MRQHQREKTEGYSEERASTTAERWAGLGGTPSVMKSWALAYICVGW